MMNTALRSPGLSWLSVIRLGLVQAALGAIVVLVTSTLNRVMVVEYALPAALPGLLVALHYAVQLGRPRFGFESDLRARRTPWIVGGMAVLALGGVLCAVATVSIAGTPAAGLALAVAGYVLVGLGVGAAGTSLLVLLATQVGEQRRAAAVTSMWILMIAGFAVTSTVAGHFLDPLLSAALDHGGDDGGRQRAAARDSRPCGVWRANPARQAARCRARDDHDFKAALLRVWQEPQARRFTWFVFISMLAYSAQELLLEPFAGLVFRYTVGASAALSGTWHAAALVGMLCVGAACSGRRRLGTVRGWTQGGCVASSMALLSLAAADLVGPGWPLRLSVMALGFANGAFTVGAIGMMMELAQASGEGAGVRMGLWGAAQAVAFGCGGVCGTVLIDAVHYVFGSRVVAFAVVFAIEAMLFLVAARSCATCRRDTRHEARNGGGRYPHERTRTFTMWWLSAAVLRVPPRRPIWRGRGCEYASWIGKGASSLAVARFLPNSSKNSIFPRPCWSPRCIRRA
jgi:BCD family chlorophyll transporter-like MFS transporter